MVTCLRKKSSVDQSELEKELISDCKTNHKLKLQIQIKDLGALMSKLHVKTDFEIRGGICRYPSLLFKGMPCRQRQTERKIYSAKLFVVVC